MKLLGSLLLIGQHFKTSSVLLVALGIAVIVFGWLPGGNFFTEFLTVRGIVRKPLPRWFGRLWFAGAGACGSVAHLLGLDPRPTVITENRGPSAC
jgi:hypothetical protein